MTYKYDVIPLTEGLDFNTATSLAKPGSLRDCMNYEFVDGAGLRRIDGYRPYDGTNLINRDKVFVLFSGAPITANAVFAKPSWLYIENSVSNPNKVPFGQVFWNSSTLPGTGLNRYMVPFVKLNCPSYADPFFNSGTIKILNSSALSVVYTAGTAQIQSTGEITAQSFSEIFGTSTQDAKNEKILHDAEKGAAKAIPWVSNNIVDTYGDGVASATAIVDVWAEELRGVTYSIADAVVFTAGTAKQVYPGDYMYARTGVPADLHTPYLVLKATLTSGTWGSGTGRFEVAPLNYYTYVSGTNDAFKKNADTVTQVSVSMRLYRDPGADALTSVNFQRTLWSGYTEDKAEIAVMYSRHSEVSSLTSDSVYGTDSNGITGGTGHVLNWNNGLSTGVKFDDAGDAEYLPLVAGGVIKAVIPTKASSGYSGTGTVTYTAGTGGASGANTAYRSNCIERVYPRFLNTGWIIPFDAGNKANGYLNKINRYKDSNNVVFTTATISGKTCTSYIHNIVNSSVPYTGASNQARIFDDQWKTTTGSATDSASIVAALLSNDGTTITNSYNWGRFPTSSVAYTSTSGLIGFSGLDGVIPEDSIIRGISVSARVEVTGSTNSALIYDTGGATIRASLFKNSGATPLGNPLEMLSASGSLAATWNGATMIETVFTAGSTTNSWGNSPLKLEDLFDPTFGVSFDIKLERSDSTAAPTGTIVIDQVTFDVTYELPSVRLYFAEAATGADGILYAGHTVISGDLVDYVVSNGSFEAGDARGFMTVTNLRTVHGTGTNPYYTIGNNYYIYNNSKLTSLVGLTSGEMMYNGFDSYRMIKAEGSLYTSVRGNFYFNADYDSFLICSGAGRMRQFDGKYMTKAYAINPRQENSEALDKPRHVAIKDFRAWLGYNSGEVTFSAPGDPMNYSGFEGAGSLGAGDNVVGLQNMPGNSLCVACLNSMKAVVGSSEEDYAIQTLVANEGAFEYSVVPAGGRILYTSNSGITTLDQTEKYGNFLPRPLSHNINSWLLPRMNTAAGVFRQPNVATSPYEGGTQFVLAHAVPYKNQYRVYFKDGTQLWMTLLGDVAQFTFVKYHYAKGNTSGYLPWDSAGPVFPLYVTTSVEKESFLPYKTLAVFDPEVSIRFRTAVEGSGTGIWHLDAGDYFCSQGNETYRTPIPHWFAVNYTYMQNPFQDKTIRKVRLEGQTAGYAPLVVRTKDGYLESLEDMYDAETGTPCSLPESPLTESLQSYKPEATIASVAATGRVITILFVGETLGYISGGGSTMVDQYPTYGTTSHHCQALFVQYEEGKEDA